MTFNTDSLSWSQPIYSLRKDRRRKLAFSEHLHFHKLPLRAIYTPFSVFFCFYHDLKKEVFEQEIPPEASLNTVFLNINIEKQKLHQQQALISVSATETATLGPRQDKVL